MLLLFLLLAYARAACIFESSIAVTWPEFDVTTARGGCPQSACAGDVYPLASFPDLALADVAQCDPEPLTPCGATLRLGDSTKTLLRRSMYWTLAEAGFSETGSWWTGSTNQGHYLERAVVSANSKTLAGSGVDPSTAQRKWLCVCAASRP